MLHSDNMRGILIGITGTDGAGKGENVRGTFARPFEIFFQTMKKNIQKVYRTCKVSVPTAESDMMQ